MEKAKSKAMSNLETLSEKYNRRLQQTEMLHQLCDGDLDKLERLEEKLKSLHRYATPADKEEVEKVLSM